MKWSIRVASMVIVMLVAVTSGTHTEPARKAEILWDRYGVPHIFAADRASMFYAEGWAQAEAQGNLLLQLYGESRGRAAEYWGASHVELDRWVQLNGVPERAKEWYDAQDPTFRTYLDAFARGINDYAKANPGKIGEEYRVVLPVTGVDVIGHPLRSVHYNYMGSPERLRREVADFHQGWPGTVRRSVAEDEAFEIGSNTWAIGPSHSASGKAMLLINPHLPWGNTSYRYMEIHLVGPNYDLYGTPQIGFPVAVNGFNRHAGWGRTVNTIDTVDFFRLTVKGGQYEYDGKLRNFEHATKTIKIKEADGSIREETLDIRRSVQGPVVYDANGLTLAMRVAGIDRPKMLEQWFRMGEATNVQAFQDALRMMAVPMWHANYADDQGHVLFVFDGLVPRRNGHDYEYWNHIVPGDISATMWTDYLSYDELPKALDPPGGWTQNANEPPWDATEPPIDRTKYARYVAPDGQSLPQMRALRSLRMITEQQKISYEQLIEKKHSTRMELADRVLPDLLQVTDKSNEAARVLANWDHLTEADSRGAVLFEMFVERYFSGPGGMEDKLRVKFDFRRPLDSAYGLADPQGALLALNEVAEDCRRLYGSLDMKWGDVFRMASGNADLPANGGEGNSGVFRTLHFSRSVGNRLYVGAGETVVCAIEFASVQRARCVLGYGNASQPGSPHLEDQLPLMAQKTLLPVWRERRDVEANLEKREQF
jgi:acyl-homoserine-lactone acylase